ncbi:GRE2 [Candida oxycetoniae]|uniref:GRE2 n=1 Tax=Candida oxycetoniae TaxID=497107 RepID=A0AAI9SUB3_9ASCO|nr:GRE2 [Candida oxycetoniae]KAI3403030.1 GRE2 [Candida oxycetoniae]
MATKVILSGATGFIAQHVVKELLDKDYKVVATVRSSGKGDHLLKLFNSPNLSYEVVEDVAQAGAFDKVLQNNQDATIFIHTASPFHFKTDDVAKDLLEPAVEGTKNALKAIEKYGKNIQKVVITSSYAAIATAKDSVDPKAVINEKDWNQITREEAIANPFHGYRASKTFAEKAAWDFVKEHESKFILSTVNPTFVFGPQLFDSEVKENLNTSSEAINVITKLQPEDAIPSFKGGWVDVRDVAKAHLVAFENPKAEHQRLLMNSGKFTEQSIVDLVREKFPELKNVPIGNPGAGLRAIEETLATIDNSKTKEILGFELIDFEKSVADSVQQIIDVRKSKSQL